MAGCSTKLPQAFLKLTQQPIVWRSILCSSSAYINLEDYKVGFGVELVVAIIGKGS